MNNEDVHPSVAYRNSVETIAEEIRDEYDGGGGLDQWVHEFVDSSQWVFQTRKALETLQYSDKQPEEWQHMIDSDATWQDIISVMAYDIMRQDVYEELDDIR